MARYLEVAAEANKTATNLLALVPEAHRADAAAMIAHLVNYGLRCAPRAVQSTVRLRAVQTATRGLPVKVDMQKRTDPKTGRTYNVLIVNGQGQAEADEGDEG